MTTIVNSAVIEAEVRGGQSIKDFNKELEEATKHLRKIRLLLGEADPKYKKAKERVDALTESIDDLNIEAGELGDEKLKEINDKTDEMREGFDDASQSGKELTSSVKGTAKGVGVFGLALNALGIGLILKAVQLFTQVLGKNQRVVTAVSKVMNFLSIAFNDLINLIIDNAGPVVDTLKAIFENPQQSIKDFGNLIKENLIERFESLLDVFGHLGSALMHLFKGEFKQALESVKDAGKEYVDVLTGVNNSVDRVVGGVTKAGKAAGKYVKSTWKSAEAVTALSKASMFAAAEQQRMSEKFQREAEILRQKRDNDLISIKDRIEANDKLKVTLDNQATAMRGVANAQLAAAQAQFKLSKRDEDKVAVIEAQTNKLGILAQIEEMRSEQERKRIALQKDSLDLQNKEGEANQKFLLKEIEFNVSLIENDKQRLEAEKALLIEEKRIEEERLKNKVNQYKKGTAARLDAEIELRNRMQEIGHEIVQNEKEIAALSIEQKKEKEEAKAAIEEAAFTTAANFSNLIGALGNENLKVQKAQALIQIGIDTATAISAVIKNGAIVGVTPVDRAINIASGIAMVLANMAKATKLLGSSEPVPDTNVGNQDLPSTDNSFDQQNQRDNRVYVLETDITNAQTRVTNLVDVGEVF